MKILIITALFLFATLYSFAQNSLSNTKWKAQTEINRSQTVDVTLDFRVDTFFIFGRPDREPEAMKFSQSRDSLYLIKISGSSPCPDKSEAWYKIEWLENGGKFIFHNISDSCVGRSRVFTQIRNTEQLRE